VSVGLYAFSHLSQPEQSQWLGAKGMDARNNSLFAPKAYPPTLSTPVAAIDRTLGAAKFRWLEFLGHSRQWPNAHHR
jgi:hypothetical protein